MINLVYIRAAILSNTGVKLKLKEVAQYLIDEGYLRRDEAVRLVSFHYKNFMEPGSKNLNNSINTTLFAKKAEPLVPVDLQIRDTNWNKPIEQDEGEQDNE